MITIERAREILRGAKGKRILVIGDVMVDKYVHGKVHRISPEAPVPVVHVNRETVLPGGAANVALNILALGGAADLAGVVGRDAAGEQVRALLKKHGVGLKHVVASSAVSTTVKTRVIAERQQVVRIDTENPPEDFAKPTDTLARAALATAITKAAGVIIEDYGKGVITQAVVDVAIREANRRKIPSGLDPKDNPQLRVKGVTVAKPNYREACLASGLPELPLKAPVDRDPHLLKVGKVLLKKWGPDFLAITLGSHGILVMNGKDKPQVIPTRAREVFDVTGAGDAVIAATVLFLAAGASHLEAATLANHVAGVVVGKLGAAVCSIDELLASLADERRSA